MTMLEWTLSTDPARLDLDRVYGWLHDAYWSPGVRRDIVERAFANSLSVGAYASDGAQLGVARAVTDQATFAWLCDVFVDRRTGSPWDTAPSRPSPHPAPDLAA